MPKKPGVISRPDAVVAFLRTHGPAKLAAIAAGAGLDHQKASVALGHAKGRGLVAVSCAGRNGVWSAVLEPVPPVKVAKPKAGGQVAAVREAPPFRPLDAASACRAGAAFASSGAPLPGLGGLVSMGGAHVQR